MTDSPRGDPLASADEGSERAIREDAERRRNITEFHRACAQRYEDEKAARSLRMRCAVEEAEGPYQALLKSPEWFRTVAVFGFYTNRVVLEFPVPVDKGYHLGSMWFGTRVTLNRRGHVEAPLPRLILQVEGSLLPIITWWETRRSIPQQQDSPVLDYTAHKEAFCTFIHLCDLVRRGRVLRVIQAARLRVLNGPPLHRIYSRRVKSRI